MRPGGGVTSQRYGAANPNPGQPCVVLTGEAARRIGRTSHSLWPYSTAVRLGVFPPRGRDHPPAPCRGCWQMCFRLPTPPAPHSADVPAECLVGMGISGSARMLHLRPSAPAKCGCTPPANAAAAAKLGWQQLLVSRLQGHGQPLSTLLEQLWIAGGNVAFAATVVLPRVADLQLRWCLPCDRGRPYPAHFVRDVAAEAGTVNLRPPGVGVAAAQVAPEEWPDCHHLAERAAAAA